MRTASAFILAFAAGFALWAISEPLTGEKEAWDSGVPYLPLGLCIASVIIAIPLKKEWLLIPAGMLAGQFAFLLWLGREDGLGPLIVVGIFFLLGYTAVCSLVPALGRRPVSC
jgi:hypothetical protein